ncbi:Predicted acetyltransferase, GNAT family [Granulicella pectinivorans]|uniref:Predicted acetyltransferase, GNAT family n=1 Tax=Granulicella pectinivorans TaxID=474950 RepID=A0A1I6LI99_9BACT|nr:GNAT family N-acetyltransferase [Granulicella pectinivorans]SFS03154.1 Predicted acetyltransferase, GNAT family [Granulicella pectinivorans]
MQEPLDNPIWNSLTTMHAALAVGAGAGKGLARRFPATIGPLAGLKEATPEAYADLAAITPEGDLAVLFLEQKAVVPAGWELLREGALIQMVCPEVPDEPEIAASIAPLGAEDAAEMVALAKLTEPGPFREGTPTLGGFLGIRMDGRLAAMAGQRLSPGALTEVSAVCTHPDFRGRGYARALVAAVARQIHARGRTPFLTSYAANAGAIKVYEQVGFATRRSFELAVLRPTPSAI